MLSHYHACNFSMLLQRLFWEKKSDFLRILEIFIPTFSATKFAIIVSLSFEILKVYFGTPIHKFREICVIVCSYEWKKNDVLGEYSYTYVNIQIDIPFMYRKFNDSARDRFFASYRADSSGNIRTSKEISAILNVACIKFCRNELAASSDFLSQFIINLVLRENRQVFTPSSSCAIIFRHRGTRLFTRKPCSITVQIQPITSISDLPLVTEFKVNSLNWWSFDEEHRNFLTDQSSGKNYRHTSDTWIVETFGDFYELTYVWKKCEEFWNVKL